MKAFIALFSFIFIHFLGSTSGRVFPTDNVEDIKFWHDYNEKYLENILKTEPAANQTPKKIAKNVIYFVGDGMSMATISAGRVFKGQLQGKSGEETKLVFESFPHLGLAKTYNTNSQVPDSAGEH